jgi:hypothetical protein
MDNPVTWKMIAVEFCGGLLDAATTWWAYAIAIGGAFIIAMAIRVLNPTNTAPTIEVEHTHPPRSIVAKQAKRISPLDNEATFLVRCAAGVANLFDVPRPDAFSGIMLNRQDQQQFWSARSFFALAKRAGKIVVDLA